MLEEIKPIATKRKVHTLATLHIATLRENTTLLIKNYKSLKLA